MVIYYHHKFFMVHTKKCGGFANMVIVGNQKYVTAIMVTDVFLKKSSIV